MESSTNATRAKNQEEPRDQQCACVEQIRGGGAARCSRSVAHGRKFCSPCRSKCPAARVDTDTPTPRQDDPMVGFSMWLNRESWGHVTDGLILLIAEAKQRQAANPMSTSGARAREIEGILRRLNARSDEVVDHV